MSDYAYLAGGDDGWLNVKREPSGTIIALCGFTRVKLTESRDGRDYFTPLEGIERGQHFSVRQGNIRSGNPGYKPAADLRFSVSTGELTYLHGKASAITNATSPISFGTHPIQIPDFPHLIGAGYLPQSRFAKNWFFLGEGHAIHGSNDRYLHAGALSNGCVTVEPTDWTALYEYLILCRSGNGATVGTITVVR